VRQRLGADLAAGVAAAAGLQQSPADNTQRQAAIKDRIQQTQSTIDQMKVEMAVLDRSIAATEARIAAEQHLLGTVARAIYTAPTNLIIRLIGAGSLRQMLLTSADLAAAGSRARAIKMKLDEDRAQLVQQRAQKAAALDQMTALERQLTGDLAALVQLRASQESTQVQLKAKMQAISAEQDRVRSQDLALADRIATQLRAEQEALIAAAIQQAWAELAIWLQSNSVVLGPAGPRNYPFIWPLRPAVLTQPFGPSDLWMEPPWGGFPHFHAGLDLAAPPDTPVLAADDGVAAVVVASAVGYGNYVVLAHRNGVATLYGHLAASLVKPGDSVVQGQPIGLEGSTGNSTGPHLHFEMRVSGQPVDPRPFLPPGP